MYITVYINIYHEYCIQTVILSKVGTGLHRTFYIDFDAGVALKIYVISNLNF